MVNYPQKGCKDTWRTLTNFFTKIRLQNWLCFLSLPILHFNFPGVSLILIAHGHLKWEAICFFKRPFFLQQPGESFGEIPFFTAQPQDFTVRSLNYSTVYLLKKSDFLSVIQDNSDDWVNSLIFIKFPN